MKIIFIATLFLIQFTGKAQIPGWHLKSLNEDALFGIDLNRTYSELLKQKKSVKVIVAVIDNGIDTAHEDLRKILWINPKELNNGKDDDKNGYADDLNGWNFIGGKSGNVKYDNLELVRIIRRDKDFYDSLATLSNMPAEYKQRFFSYRKMLQSYYERLEQIVKTSNNWAWAKDFVERVTYGVDHEYVTPALFQNSETKNEVEGKIKLVILNEFMLGNSFPIIYNKLDSLYALAKNTADYQWNVNFDPRNIVGDDYGNSKERIYGNRDVYGFSPDHGTHVAGIIAASRNNAVGIDGIADNVSIMTIRTVPDGDERDKDVANAIRYAVDNGARVINMSFGKAYSWDKAIVDEAVRYAMKKDVLIIHAAGNEHKDLDKEDNFPNKFYAGNDETAKAWIEVGASGWADDSTLVASFSNYGKTKVDVFAPGVRIYSTMPGSAYDYMDGTSMAAPVVAGIATLIRSYYPKLKAVEVKEIIMQSVVKRDVLKDKCISSGIVNAYNALKLAGAHK
jgi:subtilisin family serine protease